MSAPDSYLFTLRQRVRVAGRDAHVWRIDHASQQIVVRYGDGTEGTFPVARVRAVGVR